jgi:hypothetical protein
MNGGPNVAPMHDGIREWVVVSLRPPRQPRKRLSLRDGLNTRTYAGATASITPMRANIVGQPRSAAWVSVSAAVVTAGISVFGFGDAFGEI